MDKVDFKKVYKDLYIPKTSPMLITVPSIKFIMIDGNGDPRKTAPEKLKTVIRHPIVKLQ